MSTETERKEDKAMTNTEDARRAHELLDELDARAELSQEQEKLLRSFLPELPKQKTLEEVLEEVESAACIVTDSYWSPSLNPQDWLWELHAQLKGLKGAPVTVPALPEGIRLADHEQYGRVITSPKPNRNGVYDLLVPRPKFETGADWEYAHECELTFIDAEPAKPAHPEFLEIEADYRNAPFGTIVVGKNYYPWTKTQGSWLAYGAQSRNDFEMRAFRRYVLRWGDK